VTGQEAVIFRDARREDVPAIVALLADDVLGATREASPGAGRPSAGGPSGSGSPPGAGGREIDDDYWAAFAMIAGDPRNRVIVAEEGGRVAGTLQLTLIPGLSRRGMLRAQIEGVRVASGSRGRGLGRAMIEWAIAQAREAGCGMVQLTSDKQRPGAIRFYESLGFTATHEGLKLPLSR
jgi:GNAT superfamily N-acetyltransferase